jgi:hypothetical protein
MMGARTVFFVEFYHSHLRLYTSASALSNSLLLQSDNAAMMAHYSIFLDSVYWLMIMVSSLAIVRRSCGYGACPGTQRCIKGLTISDMAELSLFSTYCHEYNAYHSHNHRMGGGAKEADGCMHLLMVLMAGFHLALGCPTCSLRYKSIILYL